MDKESKEDGSSDWTSISGKVSDTPAWDQREEKGAN